MGKPSKFSKLAGPQKTLYASLDAADQDMAADSLVFLQGGTAKKIIFADVVSDMDGTVTSTGLTSTDGVLSISIAGLDAKTAPVAADSIMINDSENSNVLKEVTLTNLGKPMSTVMAGTGLMDGTGSIALDLDGCGDATLDPAADTIAFIDESASGDPTKLESVVDFVDAIRGTAATTGITSSSGVLTAAIKIAHLVADEKSSLFFMTGEHDFGVDTEVDTDLGAAPAKGQLIGVWFITTEVATGNDTTTNITLNKAAAGSTAMISNAVTMTVADTVGTNRVGAVNGGFPVTGANSTVAATTGHVYAYTAAAGTAGDRTAGKVGVIALFQKIS